MTNKKAFLIVTLLVGIVLVGQWLPLLSASASETFTLTLQDGLSGYTGTTDTHINNWSKTTNYGPATILALYPYSL
ncbi:MAG: hypothetical protein UT74_C0005G0066 [Parcubacteria group bacterium GW2011_GWC1_40_11]|nr:MAG: hypothetical protein UT74_C0005G0066 [Parcubacteria group bacterium GW2011_GWC1_40_11]